MISIIYGLALLMVAVLIHELGHFLAAKKVGVKVEEFAIGFGKPILQTQRGDTKYSIRPIPLGGFCKLEGELGGKGFDEEPPLKKILVLISGSGFNIIAAVVLFTLIGEIGLIPELATAYKELFTGTAEEVSIIGPVGIIGLLAATMGDAYMTIFMLAVLNVALGITNLLPVLPVLDGGRIAIVIFETMIRRRIPEKIMKGLITTSAVALLVLVAIISYFDVVAIIAG